MLPLVMRRCRLTGADVVVPQRIQESPPYIKIIRSVLRLCATNALS